MSHKAKSSQPPLLSAIQQELGRSVPKPYALEPRLLLDGSILPVAAIVSEMAAQVEAMPTDAVELSEQAETDSALNNEAVVTAVDMDEAAKPAAQFYTDTGEVSFNLQDLLSEQITEVQSAIAPTHGELKITGDNVLYSADDDYQGNDRFYLSVDTEQGMDVIEIEVNVKSFITDDNQQRLSQVLSEPQAPTEVIFIDEAVEDIAHHLGQISNDAVIFSLESHLDGVEQMSAILTELAKSEKLAAVHIISHGEAGQLNLGNASLTLASMANQHAESLTDIGDALTQQGDILIYGCDFGAGELGAQAMQQMADATDADVAASTDTTGHAELGGDWLLEQSSSDIEAAALDIHSWQGVLTSETSTTIDSGSAQMDILPDTDEDGIADVDDIDGILDVDEIKQVIPPSGTPGVFDPFPSDQPGFYQVMGNKGQLYAYDPFEKVYQKIGNGLGHSVNAISFDADRGAIIGFTWSGNSNTQVNDAQGELVNKFSLIKYDRDGEIFKIGNLPLDSKSINAADYYDGHLYIKTGSKQITIVDVRDGGAKVVKNITTDRHIGVDFAFVGSKFYQVSGTNLVSFDMQGALELAEDSVVEGETRSITGVALPDGSYGSAWPAVSASGEAELYVFNNTTGNIYRIDNIDTAPNATLALESTAASNNDGAGPYNQVAPIGEAFTDFDGDGIDNNLDIDSDNDGITDNIEAQSTKNYIAPSGVDSDGNGLDDAYQVTAGTAGFNDNGIGLKPVDTDSDSISDIADLDSDGDKTLDIAEAGHTNTVLSNQDTDHDGLDDAYDVNDENFDKGKFQLPKVASRQLVDQPLIRYQLIVVNLV